MIHSGHLTHWLGEEIIQQVLDASREIHIAIPVASCPGKVFAYKGDFYGDIQARHYPLVDREFSKLEARCDVQQTIRMAGFSGLSELISEATTGGKRQDVRFERNGTTGVVAVTNSLWYVGTVPAAGVAPAALAAGTARLRTSVGAIGPQTNAAGGDTLHLTTWFSTPTVAANTLLLYDRLWDGLIAASSGAAQSITGVPTRYATTTSPGNFGFIEQATALASTAHNWTSITYIDDAGNTGQVAASLTGSAAGLANRLDHAGIGIPLLTGDTGIRAFTSITNSSALITGSAVIVLAHPLAYLPQPIANTTAVLDGINSAFNLVQIIDDACLALLELSKGATTATSYSGQIIMVSS